MANSTSKQVKKNVPNPTGKGGFGDNPQNRSTDGRPKNAESFAHWFQVFKNMTVAELMAWNKNTPEDKRTVAADLAYKRVFKAQNDLKEFREVADRTEGKAKQYMDLTSAGQPIQPAQVMPSTMRPDNDEA